MPTSHFRTTEFSGNKFSLEGLQFLTVKSRYLKGRGDICVFVPNTQVDNLPIYILLHGVYGSAWIWALKGGAHITAARLMESKVIEPAIIAMPSDGLWGDGSGYTAHGGRQFDRWIVEEVPQAVQENISQAGSTSAVCIGGLSMGGFGALSLGSRFPNRFAAISGHSSMTSLEQMPLFVEEPLEAYTAEAEWLDVITSCRAHRDQLPPLRFDCGVDDELIIHNRLLTEQLTAEGIFHQYEEFPGGHTWDYWQEHLVVTYRFFDKAIDA